MLSDPLLCRIKENIDYCETLLKIFVQQSVKLYGKRFISFNVHSLIHLAKDVEKFGPIDSFSCYPFENHLQKLKNLVRKSAKPLPQVVKRLSEMQQNISKKVASNETTIDLYDEHCHGPSVRSVYGRQYSRVKMGSFVLRTCVPDNCVILDDDSVVMIANFVKDASENVFIIGRKYVTFDDLFTYPAPSRKIGTVKVNDADLSDLQSWPISSVRFLACRIPVGLNNDNGIYGITPIRNNGNMY